MNSRIYKAYVGALQGCSVVVGVPVVLAINASGVVATSTTPQPASRKKRLRPGSVS
jgi:hypothetical protein